MTVMCYNHGDKNCSSVIMNLFVDAEDIGTLVNCTEM